MEHQYYLPDSTSASADDSMINNKKQQHLTGSKSFNTPYSIKSRNIDPKLAKLNLENHLSSDIDSNFPANRERSRSFRLRSLMKPNISSLNSETDMISENDYSDEKQARNVQNQNNGHSDDENKFAREKDSSLNVSSSSPSGFRLIDDVDNAQADLVITAHPTAKSFASLSAGVDFLSDSKSYEIQNEQSSRNIFQTGNFENEDFDTNENSYLVDRFPETDDKWLSYVKQLSRPYSAGQNLNKYRQRKSITGLSTVVRNVMFDNPCGSSPPAVQSPAACGSRKHSLYSSAGIRTRSRRASTTMPAYKFTPLLQSNFTPNDTQRRKPSAVSLTTVPLTNAVPVPVLQRSPLQQRPSSRSNFLPPPMPLLSAPDGVPTSNTLGQSTQSIMDCALSDHRGSHNPLYDVSNEFMRVTGYTQQFKRLLSKRTNTRPRRQSSVPTNYAFSTYEPAGGHKTAKDKKAVASLGSSHELHGNTTFTAAAVALGGRRPPSPPTGSNGNGTVMTRQNVKRSPTKLIKQRSAYGRLWKEQPNQKHRLRKRKHLFLQRIKVNDFSLLFALTGIVLTIFDAELSSTGLIKKTEYISLMLRSLVVLTTMILLALIIFYHAIETKIAVIDTGAEDWRVAITYERMWRCTVELLVCSICTFPNGSLCITWDRINPDDHRTTKPISVPLDAVLSVPMFLRSYLLCRFMALHSKQFQDAATRSIAALNHIAVNFTFVLKTTMHEHPLRVLVLFTVTFWVAMSWVLTQCERYKAENEVLEDNHYLNSVWFIIITFMSIGYGDIVPNTYCGRALAITTGIVGAGVSSALIAVISRKLELSRAEKHVNQFMTDSKLTRQRKEAAASVLQHTWFIHKYKNIPKEKDDTKLRMHQRKFLAAISEFRKVKWDQRKLAEQGNALVDVAKLQSEMHETLWDMQENQDHLIAQMAILMQKVQDLQDTMIIQQSSGHTTNGAGIRKFSSARLLNQPIGVSVPSVVTQTTSVGDDLASKYS